RIFPSFPDKNEFDLFASMDPAKEVGGDFYDFFLIDDDHIGLVVADVSGKGVPAALFMVIAKTLIKNRALIGGTPAEILSYANNQLCEGNDAELFVTVWFAIVDLKTGKGIAANAGHEHPALKRADGKYELVIYKHSPAVATMEGMKFREHEFQLNHGDTLLCYTDGVTEATNKDNVLFGNDRFIEALNKNPDANVYEVIQGVKTAIEEFVGDAPQFDDITMLCFHYN
ncbi:MAG: serine/threonine-protein phosphatase, partial [Butyrivibrio sp.]|nr:serine/threonine-protein phosphatase [Butyrivibrio sp.]